MNSGFALSIYSDIGTPFNGTVTQVLSHCQFLNQWDPLDRNLDTVRNYFPQQISQTRYHHNMDNGSNESVERNYVYEDSDRFGSRDGSRYE